MKHARADYQRIQDPEGRIPDDEPVFLLRGQDAIAALTVKIYAELLQHFGASAQVVQHLREHAADMRARAHGRMPTIPEP